MGRKRQDRPAWLTPYLVTGVYANKAPGGYYLYAAHSERRPAESPYPYRVGDGFLGKVTEKDGFKPSKGKIGTLTSLYYLLPFAIDARCDDIREEMRKLYGEDGTLVYICSVLNYLHGEYSNELLQLSWLSRQYPETKIPAEISDQLLLCVQSGTAQIQDIVEKSYQDDWKVLQKYAPVVSLQCADHRYYCPALPAPVRELAQKYNLQLENMDSLNAPPFDPEKLAKLHKPEETSVDGATD